MVVLAAAAAGLVVWRDAGQTGPRVSVENRASAATSTAGPATASTPPEASFAELYQQDSDGVVRIDTVSCGADGVGTGFLLSPTVVATVNHVVDQAAVISLEVGGQRTTGTVIGSDPTRDLALVQTAAPMPGHQFTLASATPPVGTRVAAIGFPLGQPITLTQGGISGLDRSIPIDGTTRSGLIETDTPLNPGNSGGPLIDPTGHVVGLVDAQLSQANGIAYAVPASAAAPIFSSWRAAPQVHPAAACADPRGPGADSTPSLGQPGSLSGPLTALVTYFTGINTGNYAMAYAVLSPDKQRATSLSAFSRNLSTSFDTDFQVLGTTDNGDSITVGLAFTSLQAPSQGPSGETCDHWTLDYRMIQDPTGAWRLNKATGHNGSTHTAC